MQTRFAVITDICIYMLCTNCGCLVARETKFCVVAPGCRLKDGHMQCMGNTSRGTGTVRGTARRPHFSITIISVTVHLRI